MGELRRTMNDFNKVFFSGKEKTDAKVKLSLQNGTGLEHLASALGEAKSANFIDLPKAQIAISNSYVIFYGLFSRKELCIFKLSDIVNVYSSNCFYGSYDYNCKAIAIETTANEVIYLSKCMRRQKVAQYDQAIEILKDRCKNNLGSMIA